MRKLIYILAVLACPPAYSNEIYINQTGNNLNLSIVQKGEDNQITGATVWDAPISGNNNNIDINQTGVTQNKSYILFSHNNIGPVDFTLSQNGGDTYGNPDTGSYATISCGSSAGCTVNVSQ